MEVNLKKAHDLSRAALEAANKNKVSGTISISVYKINDTNELIENERSNLIQSVTDIEELVQAAYEIRMQRDALNNAKGISLLMTRRALVEARLAKITAVIAEIDPASVVGLIGRRARQAGSKLSDDIVSLTVSRLNTQKTRLSSPEAHQYGAVEDSLEVAYASPSYVESLRDLQASLTQEKTDLQDQISVLNLGTKLTLSDNVIQVLRKNKIIKK